MVTSFINVLTESTSVPPIILEILFIPQRQLPEPPIVEVILRASTESIRIRLGILGW